MGDYESWVRMLSVICSCSTEDQLHAAAAYCRLMLIQRPNLRTPGVVVEISRTVQRRYLEQLKEVECVTN